MPDYARTVPVSAGQRVDPPFASHTAIEVRALADAADFAVYGPEEPSEDAVRAYWEHVETVRRMMIRRYGRRRRLLVRLSLRSMRPVGPRPIGITVQRARARFS